MISVIIPNYNNAQWLPRCLGSVLSQTFRDLEVIVVDDGSTDDSRKVLETIAREDSRVRCLYQENGGVTAARLSGVAAAQGEWITFVDSDDCIEPDMYDRLLANAAECQAQITHCGHKMIYADGRIDYYYNTGRKWQQDRLTGLKELLEERQIEPGLCSKLFRRELFEGLETWMDRRIRNNEDLLMNFYLFGKAERAVFEDFCPYHYLIREGSASRRRLNEHLIYDPIRVKQRILDACDPELRDDARRAMAETCLYIYAKLALEKDASFHPHRENVRKEVLKQLDYVNLLPKRNAILVRLVQISPALFRLVYRTYAFLLHKN